MVSTLVERRADRDLSLALRIVRRNDLHVADLVGSWRAPVANPDHTIKCLPPATSYLNGGARPSQEGQPVQLPAMSADIKRVCALKERMAITVHSSDPDTTLL